jgi:hypothetical protein
LGLKSVHQQLQQDVKQLYILQKKLCQEEQINIQIRIQTQEEMEHPFLREN